MLRLGAPGATVWFATVQLVKLGLSLPEVKLWDSSGFVALQDSPPRLGEDWWDCHWEAVTGRLRPKKLLLSMMAPFLK